ncbi:aminoglycoside phosphotransferase family protein [Bacillus tianshenii]|uniref:aminoglycoside phosphotransferase family protein n=1 Tax=Sutcliffiella tianshenii TaxID=1463404 RepID=UPI001CD6ABA2|nr:aminoglycoside phosphotransferase family protein [Bacillus tianshenii]MCA1321538.1 aminoglycoside phosphotransferase family protein [Bacillus tianshenii]
MNIPEWFQKRMVDVFGEAGKVWLTQLDSTIQFCEKEWKLRIEGPVSNLSYNYVLHAKEPNGTPVMLKLGVPSFDFSNEINTLNVYGGKGCARLLKADAERGAMLLEKLVPGTMLSEEKDEKAAVHQFLEVWKAIRRPVPAECKSPTILDWASGLGRYDSMHPNGDGPIDSRYIEMAQAYFAELTESTIGMELLHGDLHHENILYDEEKGWLAIDPKGVVGDPYFDLISFMTNHLLKKENPKRLLSQRVEWISECLSLDRNRLLKAAVAMGILSACWGIEDQAGWEESYTCAKWFMELMSE